jgi:hypothetical protein
MDGHILQFLRILSKTSPLSISLFSDLFLSYSLTLLAISCALFRIVSSHHFVCITAATPLFASSRVKLIISPLRRYPCNNIGLCHLP